MGNYPSTVELDENLPLIVCKCGAGKATYRFSVDHPLQAKHKNFVQTYFNLKRYSCGPNKGKEVFIACSSCIREEDKKYFVSHPLGWTDKLCPYEDFEDLSVEV